MAHLNQAKHIEEEEEEMLIKMPVEQNVYTQLQSMMEKFAGTRIGQFVIEQGDRVLSTVEGTARWSLPKDNQVVPITKPLPWLPFLLLIIILRVARIWLSVFALMIGNDPVYASDVVYFLQTRRRKLRAVRMHGLKALQEHAAQRKNEVSAFQKISQLLRKAFSCTGRSRSPIDQNVMILRKFWCKTNAQEMHTNAAVAKKRTCSRIQDEHEAEDEPDQDLSCDQMLEKYAAQASDEDSDFVPPVEKSSESENTSESDSSDESTTANEDDLEQQFKLPEINLPKPIIVKLENEPQKNTKLNGNDESNIQQLPADKNIDDTRKSTPGHMSAALTKIKQNPMINNTAAAGSPSEVNAFIQAIPTINNNKVVSNLNEPQQQKLTQTEPQSQTQVKPQQQEHHLNYRPQSQHQHNYRYRGKNRRKVTA